MQPRMFFTDENRVTILYEDKEFEVPENLMPELMGSWNWVKTIYDKGKMNRYTFLYNIQAISRRTLRLMGEYNA